MRVITGTARGMKLQTLEGNDTRPTSEMIKEAIFSSIQFEIEESSVIDLFAGSGQLGIEALSRGAASCLFSDKSMDAFKIVKDNLVHTRLFTKSRVVCCDYADTLRAGEYDIAFVDPPYSKGIIDEVLPKLVPRMNDGGVIVCESDSHDVLPEKVGDFEISKVKEYKRTKVTYYRKSSVTD